MLAGRWPRQVLLGVVLAAGMLPWVARSAAPSSFALHATPKGGQLIAVSVPAAKGFDIVTLTARGKNALVLAPVQGGPLVGDGSFTWSPDGQWIAYPCTRNIDSGRDAVCLANVRTGNNYPLSHSPSISIEPFAWGPRGLIASDCNDRDLCLVNAKTGSIFFVTKTGSSARNAFVFGDDLVWSPDGYTLGLTCRRRDQQDRRFCFVGLDGKLTMQARSWNSVRFEGWTPDSHKVVWWGRFSGSEPLTYHEQNVDGSGLGPLPKNAVVHGPAYSANGRERLVTRGGNPGLAEEPLSGGKPRVILGDQSGAEIWAFAFQPVRRS